MPEQTDESHPAYPRILYEIVLYRYLHKDMELTGEAALMLERDERSGLLRSLHVTLLSTFNGNGEEVYELIIKDLDLKRRLEATVIEQYYHPLDKPVVLPRRVVEW